MYITKLTKGKLYIFNPGWKAPRNLGELLEIIPINSFESNLLFENELFFIGIETDIFQTDIKTLYLTEILDNDYNDSEININDINLDQTVSVNNFDNNQTELFKNFDNNQDEITLTTNNSSNITLKLNECIRFTTIKTVPNETTRRFENIPLVTIAKIKQFKFDNDMVNIVYDSLDQQTNKWRPATSGIIGISPNRNVWKTIEKNEGCPVDNVNIVVSNSTLHNMRDRISRWFSSSRVNNFPGGNSKKRKRIQKRKSKRGGSKKSKRGGSKKSKRRRSQKKR